MNVSPDAWRRLLDAGGPKSYAPGQVLLRQGDPGTHVLALVSGRVKVLRTSCEGSALVLGVRGAGEILGELAVLEGGGRSATVISIDRCETRVIPAARFLALVRSLRLESQFLRHAVSRIREGEEWRTEIAVLPAGPRLARALLRLSVPGPDGQADIGLDQTELGQAAGLSRSTVAAELARLREHGLIATSRRRIIVIDRAGLRLAADSDGGGA